MAPETQNIPLALDARMLGSNGTGVATYARALHDALNMLTHQPLRLVDGQGGQFAPAPRIERWFRWCDALIDRPRSVRRTGDQLRARDIFRLAQVHFDRHQAPLRLKVPGAPGIMHWTYPLPIRIDGWINSYTVHDAIPITHPSLTPIDGQRHRRVLQAILAGEGHVITVSEAARQDIATALEYDPDRIFACPTGFALPTPVDRELPDGLVPGSYFLFVGTVEPRKNIERLVTAHRNSRTSLPLVIAGPSGWRAEAIEPMLAGAGIVRLHYPPRDMLMALVRQARALLLPSLAEGFGLPIAEAMASRTAVMTSRGGATEEVAGGAALLIDPLDIGDMASAIAMLSGDDALVERLVTAGVGRSTAFTTARFAERIGHIHRTILAEYGWRSPTPPVQRPTGTSEILDR